MTPLSLPWLGAALFLAGVAAALVWSGAIEDIIEGWDFNDEL